MNKSYRKRWIAERIKKSYNFFSAIVITGARQVGKTTLVQNESPFKNWTYYDLDDPDVRFMVEEDVNLFFKSNFIVFDEIQKVPLLLNYIRSQIDRNPEKKFILTGSSNLLLMKNVSESLAGRAIFHYILPFTYREWWGMPPYDLFKLGKLPMLCPEPPSSSEFWLKRGFLPRILTVESMEGIVLWWKSYILSYLERDLRDLSSVSSLPDFKKVMERIVVSTGSLLNETEVARDTGVSQPTVHRYINLLETSNILFRVRGFYRNPSKRISKRAKAYFFDTGLASALRNFEIDIARLLEIYVFQALKVYSTISIPEGEIYHWRSNQGYEVDFIFMQGNKIIALEVKAKEELSAKDFRNLIKFFQYYPETSLGIVVYMGNSVKRVGDKFIALPWYCL